jgi:hypothetical protein
MASLLLTYIRGEGWVEWRTGQQGGGVLIEILTLPFLVPPELGDGVVCACVCVVEWDAGTQV